MALEITKENFEAEVKKSEKVALIDFWAEWCGPCRQLGPIIDELAKDLEGQAVVGKVNVDQQPELAQEYSVRSIPTMIFIKGGEVVDRMVGVADKPEIYKKIKELSN